MFCPNCGAKCDNGTKFCDECGCVLIQSDTDISFEESQNYYDSQENHYQQNMEWKSEPAFVNIPQPPEKPKKSKTGLVVGIVISVIILLVAVVTALIISGVIEINLFEKETTTQAEEEKNDKKDKETTTEENTSEEATEEETTEIDTNVVAKQNLEGIWTITLQCSSEPVYGNQYEMILPIIFDFKSDGTYSIFLDENSYNSMVYTMIDEYLAEEGYFNMNDVDKSAYVAEFGVGSEQELYELLYSAYVENTPMEEYESWIYEMPMSEEGYWAINGDYLYFADKESQISAFMSNPSAYKYDSIQTKLTQGPKDFQVNEGDESLVFRKR